MFFVINWALSVVVWLAVAYLFDFSIIGWIIGLIVSFIFKEYLGPKIIIAIGDNTRYKEK